MAYKQIQIRKKGKNFEQIRVVYGKVNGYWEKTL